MSAIFHEWGQELWMHTPYGEALALGFFDYGREADLRHLVIQQEGQYIGQIWAWHNSEVRMMGNRSSLRPSPASPEPAGDVSSYKFGIGGQDGRTDKTG